MSKDNFIKPVDTLRRFKVYKTSIKMLATLYRCLIDVETTLCVYWEYATETCAKLQILD